MDGEMVSRYTMEFGMAMMERTNRRLWYALLLAILLGVLSNAYWIYERSQYEVVSEYSSEVTAQQDLDQDSGDGGSNYSYFYGGVNGEAEGKDQGDGQDDQKDLLPQEG